MPGPPNFLKDIVAPAGRGDLARVRELIAADPGWVTTAGSHGRTMLWEAAYRGRLDVVRYLAGAGADINAHGCHYTPHLLEISPCCVAQWHRRDDVAHWLVQAGATIDVHTLAYLGDLDALQEAIRDESARLAAGHPQTEIVRTSPHSWRVTPTPWATPLAYAIAGMQEACVRWLITAGAPVASHFDDLYRLARHRANGAPAIFGLIESLSPQGRQSVPVDDPNVAVHGGWPPLVYLCRGDRGGNPEAVKALIARGACLTQHNHKGQTALHVAAAGALSETVAVLLAAGAPVNAVDDAGQTPLHAAIRSKSKRQERLEHIVSALMAAGADADQADRRGVSPREAVARLAGDKRMALMRLLE